MHTGMVKASGPFAAAAAWITAATAACAQMPAQSEAEVKRVAESITAENLALHLGVIAHDSMRGRNTPSPELMETARYIAAEFESYGLEPGGDDGYLQLFPLTRIRPADAGRQGMRLIGPDGALELVYGEDFFVQAASEVASAAGPLQLLGGTEDMPSASGKIAVLRVTTANMRQIFGGRLRDAIRTADPSGLIVVLDLSDTRFQRLQEFMAGERMVYGEVRPEAVPVTFVDLASLPQALSSAMADGRPLNGWSAELTSEAVVEVDFAPNTIGVLRGSDPELRDEYVLYTAHMDHVGVRGTAGDSIFNGADDDGSGTVSVIELARAFSELDPAPRRSMIFMTVSGEEKGLLGSQYYAENPTFPLEQTVANINLDMVGRNWADTIVAIGKGESDLGPQVDRISAAHPELDMAVIDDLWPEESFYTRSDHYNFARRGVPILFFFNGTHDDYHRPSDEVDKIGYDKMARLARLLFYLGLEVANQDARPAWDPEAYERVVDQPTS